MGTAPSRGKTVLSNEAFTFEVLSDRVNPLIGRRELEARIVHHGRSTPSIADVRRAVANALNVSESLVYVRRIITETGWGISKARIHVYSDVRTAHEFEPEHVRKKNEGQAST